MKVLTKNTDYAIRALLGLARQSDPQAFINVKALAGQEQIPYAFLRRIMQVLLKAGYVRGREGRAGGFQLQKDPSEIRILDLIRLFQGEIVLSECMFRKKLCGNRATCVLASRDPAD